MTFALFCICFRGVKYDVFLRFENREAWAPLLMRRILSNLRPAVFANYSTNVDGGSAALHAKLVAYLSELALGGPWRKKHMGADSLQVSERVDFPFGDRDRASTGSPNLRRHSSFWSDDL